MRLGHARAKFLEAFAKLGLLEGASTCNLKLDGHDVLDKKTKVKFGIITHGSEYLLDYVHIDVWGPTKTASFRHHRYFVLFIDAISR